MKKLSLAIIIILVLALIGVSTLLVLEIQKNNEKEESKTVANDDGEEVKVIDPFQEPFTWIVEPEFEYDEIVFSPFAQNYQGIIVSSNTETQFAIDIETGEKTEADIGGEATGFTLLYNEEDEMWGLITYKTWGEKRSNEGNIATTTSFTTVRNAMNNYQKISEILNSVRIFDFDEEEQEKVKYAFVKDGEFITEFIYDDVDGCYNTETPAVSKNGKWGFINEDGDQLIGFIFDGAVSIETGIAFVNQNGKWGIIQIEI